MDARPIPEPAPVIRTCRSSSIPSRMASRSRQEVEGDPLERARVLLESTLDAALDPEKRELPVAVAVIEKLADDRRGVSRGRRCVEQRVYGGYP